MAIFCQIQSMQFLKDIGVPFPMIYGMQCCNYTEFSPDLFEVYWLNHPFSAKLVCCSTYYRQFYLHRNGHVTKNLAK